MLNGSRRCAASSSPSRPSLRSVAPHARPCSTATASTPTRTASSGSSEPSQELARVAEGRLKGAQLCIVARPPLRGQQLFPQVFVEAPADHLRRYSGDDR